jgi:hypothetical protein
VHGLGYDKLGMILERYWRMDIRRIWRIRIERWGRIE